MSIKKLVSFFSYLVSQKHRIVVLGLVLVFAVALRFYQLGELPVALNRDEASLGYTAWSILYTGADEHGARFPINIQSFGDWKLPLYVYKLVPIIAVFGLSEWSVRLPSAMAGVLIVILTFILSRLLIEKIDQKKHIYFQHFPYLASAFVAISPWSIHLSRIAYEANLTMAIFLLGLIAFLMANQRALSLSKVLKQQLVWAYPVSAFCFGLTLFGYHSYQIFTPLFGVWLLFSFRKDVVKLFKTEKVVFGISALIVVLFSVILLASQQSKANTTKYGGISIFSEAQYAEELFHQRQLVSILPAPLAKAYANSYQLISHKFFENIADLVNVNFLFLSGGTHGSHNFSYSGNLYWFGLLTISMGIWLVKNHPDLKRILIPWVAIAMIAPLITIEANHSIRFSPALVPLEMLSALGIVEIWRRLKLLNFFVQRFSVVVMLLIGVSSLYAMVISYFVIFPQLQHQNWPWYMEEIVNEANTVNDLEKVYLQGESSSPYIWFLFYHPEKYTRENLVFYPPTNEGFVHVQQLKNVYFGTIDWKEVISANQPAAFFLQDSELPDDPAIQTQITAIKSWEHPHSKTKYTMYRYEPK